MRFVPNPAFKQQIQREPRFPTGMGQITEGTAEAIREAALPFRDTGNFIRRIDARKGHIELERHFAHIMELGSVNNPPQANVRRGVREAGLRFVDDGPQQAE